MITNVVLLMTKHGFINRFIGDTLLRRINKVEVPTDEFRPIGALCCGLRLHHFVSAPGEVIEPTESVEAMCNRVETPRLLTGSSTERIFLSCYPPKEQTECESMNTFFHVEHVILDAETREISFAPRV